MLREAGRARRGEAVTSKMLVVKADDVVDVISVYS